MLLRWPFSERAFPGSHRAKGRRGTHNHPSQSAEVEIQVYVTFHQPLWADGSATARRGDLSARHPIISITGSSGAGTTTVTTTFQQIFRRESVGAAIVDGDAFHRYDRDDMRAKMSEAQNKGQINFSHFGPEANLFEELETLFRAYGESIFTMRKRPHPTDRLPEPSRRGRTSRQTQTCSSTRGCMEQSSPRRLMSHTTPTSLSASCRSSTSNGFRSCTGTRWHAATQEAIVDTILRRMPDYVNYILSSVLADARQFPACPDRRHIEPVHRA